MFVCALKLLIYFCLIIKRYEYLVARYVYQIVFVVVLLFYFQYLIVEYSLKKDNLNKNNFYLKKLFHLKNFCQVKQL